MANGFRPFLLTHLKQIAQEATPQYKLEPVGFLNFLQSQNKPQILRLDNAAGHRNSVVVKYLQRLTRDFTDTTKSCDYTNVVGYHEANVSLSSTRQIAIHLEDETVAQYEDDASRTVMVGQPATAIMNELLERIFIASSAILEGVNLDLATTMALNFGVNRRTGNNLAAAINLNRSGTTEVLTDGLTQILADYKNNGGSGIPQIWGSGLMYNFLLQQFAKSANQFGLDTSLLAAGVKFYHDLDAANTLGANQIGVFQPNSVQIVEYMEYTGFKAGVKPGNSVFGTMALPMQAGTDIIPVLFDFQLRYNDCPTTLTDAYYGTSLTLQKGYNFIISKQCGLFTIPADAYRATDVLNGNRGSLRYSITNTCDAC